MKVVSLCLFLASQVLTGNAISQQSASAFDRLPTADWLGPNARLALDLSYRVTLPSSTGKPMGLGAIGVDFHKVFSSGNRDFGTLTAQGYLLRFDNAVMRPSFVDNADDWDWTWRILTFNYTQLTDGWLNIKAGHIEMPFGLEWNADTNGTIRQYQVRPNLGLKLDWGFGINGVLNDFDYEVTVTRGSGMEYRDTGDPYAVCGRIGSPNDKRFIVGLSLFKGETGTPGPLVDRTRFAIDAQQQLGAYTLQGELSLGDDNGDQRTQTIAEVNWVNSDESLMVYLQNVGIWKETAGSTDSYNRIGLGAEFRPDSHWDLSAELRQDLDAFQGADQVFTLLAQLRYRF